MNATIESASTPHQRLARSDTQNSLVDSSNAKTHQYLTFMLNEEQFAVEILHIKEIIEYAGLTSVPMMPVCVRGVINLRGSVVPVIDLSARFDRAPSVIGKRSCVVVVEVNDENGEGQRVLGVLVDAVNAVVDIVVTDIEATPSFGTRVRPEFVSGIGKYNGKFVILLDLDQALSTAEIVELANSPIQKND